MSTNNSKFWTNFPYPADYEYRSTAEVYGWPLVHIARGIDPETGRMRVARGIIALGDIAVGVFSLGGISVGIFSIGGISLGSYAFGGIALGGVATGAIAVGLCSAVGVIAAAPGVARGILTLTPNLAGFVSNLPERIGQLFGK
jgi:hypothetical protein